MQPPVSQEGKMSFANYEWLQTLMYVLMWRSLAVNWGVSISARIQLSATWLADINWLRH